MPQLPLSYDSPLEAVFLRILAWELYVAKEKLTVNNVTKEQVQAARNELGLAPLQNSGGAADDFIQRLRKPPKPTLSPSNTPPRPVEQGWSAEWRLLYLPPHNLVRQLSSKPVWEPSVPASPSPNPPYSRFKVTLRDPAVPTLDVFVGTQIPPNRIFHGHRGLYFLRLANQLYVGKTDEFDVRLSQHQKKFPHWWVFVSPEQSAQTFTLDALAAAESLLISFWNEVSRVENQNRGSDQKPAFIYLQQGILLVEAASAVLLWLMREKKDLNLPSWSIPFKPWNPRVWPRCYEKLPGSS